MEKQRTKFRSRFINGLLAFFLFSNGIISPLFAAPRVTLSEIKSLVIYPESNGNKPFYTDTEIKFVLEIPNLDSSNLDISNPLPQKNINFKTMRRSPTSSGGILIELWYEFTAPGLITPKPLEITVYRQKCDIKFTEIQVQENPKNLKPQMVIIFDNDVQTISTDKNFDLPLFDLPLTNQVRFTVFVQYSPQVLKFNYEIPKNALLEITKTYEITEVKYREKSFTADLIPVADFVWTPLVQKKTYIPEISLLVTDFDGFKKELVSPLSWINITDKIDEEESVIQDNLFNDIFMEDETESIIETSHKNTDIYSNIDKKRKIFSLLVIILLPVFSFFILTTFLRVLKKKITIPYILIPLVLLVLLITSFNLKNKSVFIYTGGTVNPIPEENTGNHIQLLQNTKVKILKETNEWYCIESGENIGWTKKENILRY